MIKELTKKPNTITLILIYGMGNTLIVALTPALNAIQAAFNVSKSQIYYISIFAIAGYAFGPLINPLISVRHGRRGAVLFGCILAMISILATILFSTIIKNYNLMLVFRFLSVLGASCSVAAAPAIIGDYYDELNMKKLLFLISAIFCLYPGIVMGFCGTITDVFGWISCEIFLALYVILTFIMSLMLPETSKEIDKNVNVISNYLKTSSKILSNIRYILYVLLSSIGIIAMYYFVAEGPIISLHYLKLSSAQYGYLSIIPYFGAMISMITARAVAAKYTFKLSVYVGFSVTLIISLIMLCVFSLGYINIFTLFILTTFIFAAMTPIFGSGLSLAINETEYKGMASAYALFIIFILSAIVPYIAKEMSLFLGYLVYPIIMLSLSIICIVLYLILRKFEN